MRVCVTLSTAEVEHVSLSKRCTDVQGTKQSLSELNKIMGDAPMLHVDNTAAITWVEKALAMKKAKHIHIPYHFKDIVAKGAAKMVNINSEDNISDMFTKPLDKN